MRIQEVVTPKTPRGTGGPISLSPRLLQLATLARTIDGFLLPFADHFRAQGWRVSAGCGDIESMRGRLGQRFDALHQIPWARTLLSLGNYTSALREVRRVVSEGAYDLVHVHTPIAAFLARFALRGMRDRTKVVYTAHGLHFGCSSRPYALSPFFYAERLAGRWTDAMAVINQVDLRIAREHNLCSGGKVFYTPGIGVDVARLSKRLENLETRPRKRAELGAGQGDFVLLMAAEFNPGKRHRDLLQAAATVEDPRLRLWFAGDGPGEESCRQMARQLGLADRVRFLGWRSDVPDLIQAADATTLPSEREGLPRSIMESLALGAPVIATRIRGTEELLANGAGLLFATGNIGQYADCIRQLAANPDLRRSCSHAGRERVREFDIARVLECYAAIYGELLGQLRV